MTCRTLVGIATAAGVGPALPPCGDDARDAV